MSRGMQCGCNTSKLNINCIEKTIWLWRPCFHLICPQCFWGEKEEEHEVLLYKLDLEKRTEEVLRKEKVLKELYKNYCKRHENIPFVLFKNSLEKIVIQKREELTIVLMEKDISASKKFQWNGKYR